MHLLLRRNQSPDRAGRAARAARLQARGLDGALRALAATRIGCARRWCCRPATAPSSMPRARIVDGARADLVRSSASTTASIARGLAAASLRARRSRRGAAPVPGGRRPRLAGRRRAADSRPGEGSAQRRPRARRAAGPLLNRLFHSSFGVGKRVRTETGLGSGAVSVSFAAVALARKIFGDLKGRNVLVIGAGEMGKLTALHMKSQGVQQRHDRQPHDGARGAHGRSDRRRVGGAVGGDRRRARRERHRHHRDRRGGARF